MAERNERAQLQREVAETSPLRAGRMSVDRIRFHAKQIRDLGDLRELAANLRIEGMHQALLVQKRGDIVEVVDGHRRLAAARQAGMRTVPVVIQDWREDVDVVSAMVTTDIHKKRLTPEEKRAAVQTLQREGMSVPDIAERFGVAVSTVYGWLTDPASMTKPVDEATVSPAPAVEPKPAGAQSTNIAAAPRQPREPRPPSIPVWVESLRSLADRWEQKRGPDGLGLDDTVELFREIRALTGEVAS